jgi:hypothetical protein
LLAIDPSETLVRMRSLLIACALALPAGACGASSPTLLDAAPTVDADRLTECLIPADYGALGTRTGTQDATHTGTPSITVVLDPGPPQDVFFLALGAGKGAFAGGLKTGTFTLDGTADASFKTCGVCTSVLGNIDATSGPSKFYFADAGTVTLTTTNPVTGSAQNLHLVEIDLGTSMAIPGGCTATLGSITFGS